MTIFEAIILGIVEGITEFLPVSSTGHMILASTIMGIQEDTFTKLFEICIQLGAILSVVVVYWKRFVNLKSIDFYLKLLIAVVPALILGFLFNDAIEGMLESPLTVSAMLIAGGVVLLFIDKIFNHQSITSDAQISKNSAFMIGLWQCISMVPGVSRSAASIIGGMQQKLSRKEAAEFSFFLAVPTMAAATGYSLILKDWDYNGAAVKGFELLTMQSENLLVFIIGTIVSFIVALFAIRSFIKFLQKRGFFVFGVYRIIVGFIMMMLLVMDNVS